MSRLSFFLNILLYKVKINV